MTLSFENLKEHAGKRINVVSWGYSGNAPFHCYMAVIIPHGYRESRTVRMDKPFDSGTRTNLLCSNLWTLQADDMNGAFVGSDGTFNYSDDGRPLEILPDAEFLALAESRLQTIAGARGTDTREMYAPKVAELREFFKNRMTATNAAAWLNRNKNAYPSEAPLSAEDVARVWRNKYFKRDDLTFDLSRRAQQRRAKELAAE